MLLTRDFPIYFVFLDHSETFFLYFTKCIFFYLARVEPRDAFLSISGIEAIYLYVL